MEEQDVMDFALAEDSASTKATYSLRSERFAIGAALLDHECLSELMNRIHKEQFYDSRHKAIMEAIESLYNRDAEVAYATVIEELNHLKKLDSAGGEEYVLDICNSIPSFEENTANIDIVEDKWLVRELHRVCSEINASILKDEVDFRELSAEALSKVEKIANSRKSGDIARVNNYTEDVIKLAEGGDLNDRHLLGVDTGFNTLNKYTKGLKKGEMIVLAARPGVGKSALGMNIATNACLNMNAKVAFFSLEMANNQLAGRILSSFSGVPYGKIQDGDVNAEEMKLLQAAKIQVDNLNLFLDVECDNNLSEIRAKCLKLARQGTLDLVVIDYLQLITDTRRDSKSVGNRQEEVARISRGLKKLARELEVPVLALSQLSRDIDKAEGRTEPTIADIRESGAIEQDADIVLLLYRKNAPAVEGEGPKGPTNHKVYLNVAKNRQGKQGKIELYFKGAQFKFTEVEDADADIND